MTCARRRLHPAVEARESLRRGQTREMTWKEESDARSITLHLPLPSRLENGRIISAEPKDWVKKQSSEKGSELTGASTARLYLGWGDRVIALEVRWTTI